MIEPFYGCCQNKHEVSLGLIAKLNLGAPASPPTTLPKTFHQRAVAHLLVQPEHNHRPRQPAWQHKTHLPRIQPPRRAVLITTFSALEIGDIVPLMPHFTKPEEGSWTEHFGLGTGPVSYADSISPEHYELELSLSEIVCCAENAVRASFLPAAQKATLLGKIRTEASRAT